MAESSSLTSPALQQRSPQTPNGYGSLNVTTTPGGTKVDERYRRSQVSHAFLLKKEADVEAQHLASPSGSTVRVQVAINASLAANVVRRARYVLYHLLCVD
jgi:hypothetical protein